MYCSVPRLDPRGSPTQPVFRNFDARVGRHADGIGGAASHFKGSRRVEFTCVWNVCYPYTTNVFWTGADITNRVTAHGLTTDLCLRRQFIRQRDKAVLVVRQSDVKRAALVRRHPDADELLRGIKGGRTQQGRRDQTANARTRRAFHEERLFGIRVGEIDIPVIAERGAHRAVRHSPTAA